MVFTRFVLLVAFLLASTHLKAAYTIDVGPSGITNITNHTNPRHVPGGVATSYPQNVKIPGGPSVPAVRNPRVGYPTISNGLKGYTRINPASAAASVAFATFFYAVDWAWDELTQEWVKYEMECPVGQICAIDGQFNPIVMCSRQPYAINDFGQVKTVVSSHTFVLGGVSYPAGTTVSLFVVEAGDTTSPINSCIDRYPTGRWPTNSFGQFPVITGTVISTPGQEELVPVPLGASDWQDMTDWLPSAVPTDLRDFLDDYHRRNGEPLPHTDLPMTGPSSVPGPETTTTSTSPTGDTTTTVTSTNYDINYGPTTITTTQTTITNNYTNGNPTGTTTTTETAPPGGAIVAGDGPIDCEFMPTVCAFIDWFKTPFVDTPVDMPEIVDFDLEREYSFGLTASCPDPYVVSTQLFGSISISWQPFCDLASMAKPLVLASSGLYAAFIVLGLSRGRQ